MGYFIHRWLIRAYFASVLTDKTVRNIQKTVHPFLRYSGLYTLSIRKGNNIFVKSVVLLVLFELLLVPFAIFTGISGQSGLISHEQLLISRKIAGGYGCFMWILITILAFLTRSNYKKRGNG